MRKALKDDPWLLVLLIMLLALIATWAWIICSVSKWSIDTFKDWQTLAAATFAVGAAFIAWINVNRTMARAAKAEGERRAKNAKDVATILHAELAHLVARCCFDSEAPWQQYWPPNGSPRAMHADTLRKFAPVAPVIYLGSVGQLALIGDRPSQILIEFHYRLGSLRREIKNFANSADKMEAVAHKDLRLVGLRFFQTLKPGLHALEALGETVKNAEEKEEFAFKSYYETRDTQLVGTLRSHIMDLLPKGPPESKRPSERATPSIISATEVARRAE